MEQIQTARATRSPGLSGLTVGCAVLSGLLASACCLGPLLLAALGLGGAAFLARLDAYRQIFTLATFGLLTIGVWAAYRKPNVIEGDDCGCEYPKASKHARVLLWVAAVVAVAFWAFPYILERIG